MNGNSNRKPGANWSWVQFGFGLVFGAAINFLALNTWALSLGAHVMKVAGVAAICGVLAGRFGDPIWNSILNFLRNQP